MFFINHFFNKKNGGIRKTIYKYRIFILLQP